MYNIDQTYRSVFLGLVFAMSFGNNDPAVNQLHQQMKQFLNEEEAALEQRIT